ncbi:MAG: M1 family metallopeptidase, partial [Persicimonas sp.]
MNASRKLILIVALSWVGASCAGAPQATTVAESKADDSDRSGAFDGHERLPGTVEPTHYRLDLTIDPESDTFSGETAIEVDIEEEVDHIDLHAEDLDFERVELVTGEESVTPQVLDGENGGITLALDEPIGPGDGTLEFAYKAPLDDKPEGLFRVEDEAEWYAFTQFQPLEARQAFPSFDEPAYKAPFEVSLRVPEDLIALANTSQVGDESDEEGWKTLRFQETPPLATYLVAFAVGDFDVVEAPEDAIEGVSLRAITPRGDGELADYALEQAPDLLEAQTEYFGMSMPFDKLDLVAVPNFAAGAMENVGLVTFRERFLLLDEEDATARDRYAVQSIMAHEFAHMWFGNYMTPAWWDDLWLNEAFATWMATETLATVAPELEPRIDAVQSSLKVMKSDARQSARAIRQPIREGDDVYNAFDSITYSKGRAVLRMIENWIGPEAFREGVQDFIEDNAFASGTTDELVAAWADASGERVEATLRPFVDQAGVPLVDIEPSCEDGVTTLDVRQQRYAPAGSDIDTDERWNIPLCVHYEVDGRVEQFCEVVEDREASVEFEAESCPDWIHPNADETGYYHGSLPGDAFTELAEEHRSALTLPELVALLPHAEALVEAQQMAFDDFLRIVEAMAEEEHRAIAGQVVSALYDIEEIAKKEGLEDAFESWAGDLLVPHAHRLGFTEREDDTVEDRLLRPSIIRATALLASYDGFRKQAVETADEYLS